jgi:hypothetical protein
MRSQNVETVKGPTIEILGLEVACIYARRTIKMAEK